TVQVRFDAKISVFGMTGTIKGKAVLGEGDKMRLEADVEFSGKNAKATLVGDGNKVFTKDSEKPQIDIKNSPKDLGAYIRGVWPRVGMFAGMDEGLKNDPSPKAADAFQISDFKLGAKEKINGVDTQVIEYKVVGTGKDKATYNAKMWIDLKASLPAKLE